MAVCVVRIILEKLAQRQNSECCNAAFWQVRRIGFLEISRCCRESILTKVSDIIIYIMKIMWRDLKKFVRVVSEIYKKVLKIQILNEVALTQVVRKRVSFQDRKKENTPKFPGSEIWY